MWVKSSVFVLAGVSVLAAFCAALVPAVAEWAAVVAFAAALGAILQALHTLSSRLWSFEERVNCRVSQTKRDTLLAVAAELHSMHVILRRFPGCSIPTTAYSMRFSNLHVILDLLDRTQPHNIVEFGSGISTLCAAAWLKERGRGRIVSFDHDAGWAEVSRGTLLANHLEDVADVVDAPLVIGAALPNEPAWYDIGDYLPAFSDIDLVIIDGPPAGETETRLSRFQALPALYDRLSPTCRIVLDDAVRPGEVAVVKKWLKMYPEFELRMAGGVTGLAILERRAASKQATAQTPSRQHIPG